MKGIETIDNNLLIDKVTLKDGMRCYKIPNKAFSLHGVFYDYTLQTFLRMDKSVAKKVSEGVCVLSEYTSGGRVWFRTNAKQISITVTYDSLLTFSKMSIVGQGAFVLCREQNGDMVRNGVFAPNYDDKKGFSASANLTGEMSNYCLYFPLYNTVSSLEIALNDDAEVYAFNPYKKDVKPILYYGSSITMGGCVGRCDNTYQSIIAKWNKVDFINLGFSGCAKAEEEMVDYIASIDCSLFVCDYDHNAPSAEFLKDTHFRLYSRYRKIQQKTPILFISAPNPERYDVYGQRKKIIEETYKKAKKLGDNNVWFLDGKKLMGSKDRDLCFVDGSHPNDLGFYRMAKVIYNKMTEINELYR